MKIVHTITLLAFVAITFFIIELPQGQPPLGFRMISDAEAVLGVRRRTRRRSVAVGYSAGESAAAQQQAAAAPPPATAAPTPAASPAPTQAPGALPMGVTVKALPAACTNVTVADVAYSHCGPDYYRAVFQGSNLVYVTAQP
jgi:hypothetical protein